MDELAEIMKKAGYSDLAIEYFVHKTNLGSIENPTIHGTYKGVCGDTIELYLLIEDKIIRDAKFQAIGCAGANTAGSAVTEMIKNLSVDEAEKIIEKDIIFHLGNVPAAKSDCISLACKTLETTLIQYKKNEKKSIKNQFYH